MAVNTNARFYRLESLPNFAADGKHVGLFVYVPEHTMQVGETWIKGYTTINDQDGSLTGEITVTYVEQPTNPEDNPNFQPAKIDGGLWFGGRQGWELLTNVADGLGWSDIYSWFDGNVAGEAEIFVEEDLNVENNDEHGTKYTIFDPVLDRTNGLHASTEDSDEHTFTVGDGALQIKGNAATTYTNGVANPLPTGDNIPVNDVHSANDVLSSILELDNSLVWTPSGNAAPYGGTIGVRTKTTVSAENPVVTLQDIVGLNGAMHLVGTLGATNEWPDQTGSNWITSGTPTGSQELLKAGDTFIVTTPHQGPDGQSYEVGDTVFYYENNGSLVYKVVNQNITTGKADGQHAAVDMPGSELAEGKLVVATTKGIATTSNGISDFVTGIVTTQEIVNEEVSAEGSNIGVTYTVTTTITRPDGADSDANPDTETVSHDIIFHSNNNSLTIQESTVSSEQEHQINFDLVWLTTID